MVEVFYDSRPLRSSTSPAAIAALALLCTPCEIEKATHLLGLPTGLVPGERAWLNHLVHAAGGVIACGLSRRLRYTSADQATAAAGSQGLDLEQVVQWRPAPDDAAAGAHPFFARVWLNAGASCPGAPCMCGVIGTVYEHARADLGEVAAELLRTLEYRGYDSTGAAIQGAGEEVVLRKGVGAPSAMVHSLGITRLGGQILCGQVRWATFGAVTDENSQPHVVRCHAYLYGAHNGNVTSCDPLKAWLEAAGHTVCSDNDGEMVVHAIEHYFARALADRSAAEARDPALRRTAMRRAIVDAAPHLEGSYAAVIVDPVSRCLWAIKHGSSLYFGISPPDAAPATAGGRFAIASSDLSSVLKLTRTVVPLREGEMVEFDALGHALYTLRAATVPTASGPRLLAAGERFERAPKKSRLRARDAALHPPFRTFMEQEIAAQEETVANVTWRLFGGGPAAVDPGDPGDRGDPGDSDDSDAAVAREEAAQGAAAIERFLADVEATIAGRGRLYALSCGSSCNAARAAALAWNELAHVELSPLLPGEFRERASRGLVDGDLLLSISQSGETKDLIDVLNDVIAGGRAVRRVALVNNVNSTLAEEKSDLVLPLGCGPEVAVPATKSFMNQLAMLHGLALRLGERRAAAAPDSDDSRVWRETIARHRRALATLPALLAETARSTAATIEAAAEILYLRPSLHLLGIRMTGLAGEGALKIREVVLNHAEGFEGSEFKHGPNTILGFNTVYGPEAIESAIAAARGDGAAPRIGELLRALSPDYPLIYLTGPDERDVNLTISQLNTHKIRGSTTIVIAEEHAALRAAAEKAPVDNPDYRAVYIVLPRTGDPLLTQFTATVALQRLALTMSEKKMAWLDRRGVTGHGVHPDVPKNVSKSITVD